MSCPSTTCPTSTSRSRGDRRWRAARMASASSRSRRPSSGGGGTSRSTRRCWLRFPVSARCHCELTRFRAVTMAYGPTARPSSRCLAARSRDTVSWTMSSTASWSRTRLPTTRRSRSVRSTMSSSSTLSLSSSGPTHRCCTPTPRGRYSPDCVVAAEERSACTRKMFDVSVMRTARRCLYR